MIFRKYFVCRHTFRYIFSTAILFVIIMMAFPVTPNVGMRSGRQVSSTRVYTTDSTWRVWAVREPSDLVSVYKPTTFGYYGYNWFKHDIGSIQVGGQGVASTWWVSGSDRHERAYFFGTNNYLYEYALVNGSSATLTQITLPAGKTPTGHLTAMTGTYSVNRYIILYATMTDGSLYMFLHCVGYGGWSGSSIGTGYHTARPLASSVNPSETIWSAFVVRNDNTIDLVRWNSGWIIRNLGKPSGINVCGSMSSSQAYLSSTEYRLYLFCTKSDGSIDKLYYARSTSEGSTDFAWWYFTMPGGATLDYSGYTVASTSRPNGVDKNALDAYVLGNDDRVYRITVADGYTITIDDLGKLDELSGTDGGMTAVKAGFSEFSRGYFIGFLNQRNYLYSREGLTWGQWEAAGDGNPLAQISSTPQHTESMRAEYKGKTIAAAIVRPGCSLSPPDTNYAYVQTQWSSNDGLTWGSPRDVDRHGRHYVSDPVAAFNDSGKAYIGVTALNFPNGDCKQLVYYQDSVIYYVTTMDGSSFTSPVEVDSTTGKFDHGWLGVWRNPAGPDKVHFTWWDYSNYVVRYRNLDEGTGLFSPIVNVCKNWICLDGPPTLSVGPDGSVYIAANTSGTVKICKMNAAFTECDHEPFSMSGNLQIDDGDIPISGGYFIKYGNPWSIQASPKTSNKLFYTFQKLESDGTEKDIYSSVGTYNGAAWSWDTPVAVSTVNDDKDQFGPAVTVVYGLGNSWEAVHVSWYDRKESCTGGNNYCIRARRAVSFVGGLGFVASFDSQKGALTDPMVLPYHCKHSTCKQKFIGDYHESVAEPVHTHHNWSSAPLGSPDSTGILTEGFLSNSTCQY